MKCRACGHDDDNGSRSSDDFIRVEIHPHSAFIATFRQGEDEKDVVDDVELFACPKCGTIRLASWRLLGNE